jgi:hypothetical protein
MRELMTLFPSSGTQTTQNAKIGLKFYFRREKCLLLLRKSLLIPYVGIKNISYGGKKNLRFYREARGYTEVGRFTFFSPELLKINKITK